MHNKIKLDKIKINGVRTSTVNELARFSPWPARLLGVNPYSEKHKTSREIIREFEHEKWGPLLKRVLLEKGKVSIEKADKMFLKKIPDGLTSIGDELYLLSKVDFNNIFLSFIESTLKKLLPASALVELGCGYGRVILRLRKLKEFSSMQFKAAEYTPSGIKLINELAKRQRLDIETGYCDFSSAKITNISVPPNAIIFTCSAVHYVPKLKNNFVSAIASFKPKTVVHFEPCYEHCDNKTLLGLMRRRYIEVNDYNKNLVSLLHKQQDNGKIKILLEKPAVLGSNFCKSYYLESYGQGVKYLQCLDGDEIVGGVAFIETDKGIRLMPYHVYCGIIFKNFTACKNVVQNDIKFSVTECFAEYLFGRYQNVAIINHWDVVDMRPFLWLNYHEREKGFYKIEVSYTSLLDISAPKDISGYRKGRKASLKKSEKVKFITEVSDEIETLDSLHNITFERQGIKRSEEESKFLPAICRNLLDAKAGLLLITEYNGIPASASFFAYDHKRAYYLFGATDPEYRQLEAGTKNLVDSFSYLNETLNIKELDMVGVNSPPRGSFKLSFGGKIIPYYTITKVPHDKN